jgi:lantibiotic modifying enzyme
MEDDSGFSGVGGQNRPLVNGKSTCIADYVPQLLEGFEETYRFILLHKDDIEKKLRLFEDCCFRVILRPTSTYSSMLEVINDLPEHERRTAANKLLRRAYEKDIDPERINKAAIILESEIYALTHNWVPLFYTHGNSTSLFCDGRQLGLERGGQVVMDYFFRLSPVDAAKKKIRMMDEPELKKQMAIIRTVYHSKEELPEATDYADWKTTLLRALQKEQIPKLPGSYIHLSGSNGKGIWLSGGFTLYEGATGLLCALAALGQEEEPLFQKLYQDLELYILRQPKKFQLNGNACALGSGVAGIIAGLIHVSELTGRKKYLDEGYALLESFEESVTPKTETDVLGGLAGLCLQLPKLKGKKAKCLARILMQDMMKANTRLTGAGHGKAGLALALGALQFTLETNEADQRILQLLREEDTLFIPERNNWPDLREEGKVGFMGGWCSGAPGIGMYRKKLMEYTANSEILEICRRDAANTKAYLEEHRNKELQRDTLCCGNAARLMSASYLGVEMSELKKSITRSVDPASPRLFHLVNTADHQLSLMQGAAGVGYALALYGDEKSGGMLR